MATREQARLALTTKIEALKATWTAYPLNIEYDNLPKINTTQQVNPYLCVSLMYHDGYQLDLSNAPRHRMIGTIVLEAKAKEGQGTKKTAALLEHFYPELHMSDANIPLRTEAAKFRTPPPNAGRQADVAIIPFWFDSSS